MTESEKASTADLNDLFKETLEQRDARMKWWREARFGMFVHWGLFTRLGEPGRANPPLPLVVGCRIASRSPPRSIAPH